MEWIQYRDSWIPLTEIGTRVPPYRPTIAGPSFINAQHQVYAACRRDDHLIDIGIPGWLRPEDALKLYEMAYFSMGDILEIGCHQGLSTSILARAAHDAGAGRMIVSIDIVPAYIAAARQSLSGRGLGHCVRFLAGDATLLCREFVATGQRFGFVFIDHSHTYEDVASICRLLPELVCAGGFCLFHDFNDARNTEPGDGDYGVVQAVRDCLSDQLFTFYGIFGCTALFRAAAEYPGQRAV